MNSGRAAAGGEENEPGDTLPRPEQLMADRSSRGPGESPEGWQELTFEEATAADESLSERERQLRAMYARVCKKSKPPGHSQPASPDTSREPEEEQPPPLPEKHFDVVYETLGLGSESQQDGEGLTLTAQPEE